MAWRDRVDPRWCSQLGVQRRTGRNLRRGILPCRDNETQLTTGMFGKPTQGYGFPITDAGLWFSNNATGSFGPPNFSAAAFRYDGGSLMLQGSLPY
jgi:uncharacterized protein (DUF2141 family)